jgi:hypothetical protein
MCSVENGQFKICGKEGCAGLARNNQVAVPLALEEDLTVRVIVNNNILQVFVTTPDGIKEVFSIERNNGIYVVSPICAFFLTSQVAGTLGHALQMFLSGNI